MTASADIKKPSRSEQRRLAILRQAEELNVPGWATPLWRQTYGAHEARHCAGERHNGHRTFQGEG